MAGYDPPYDDLMSDAITEESNMPSILNMNSEQVRQFLLGNSINASDQNNGHPSHELVVNAIQQAGGNEDPFGFDHFAHDLHNEQQARPDNDLFMGHVPSEPAMPSNTAYHQGMPSSNQPAPINPPMPMIHQSTQQAQQPFQNFPNQTPQWNYNTAQHAFNQMNQSRVQPPQQMPLPIHSIPSQLIHGSHKIGQQMPHLMQQNNGHFQVGRPLQNIAPAPQSRTQPGSTKGTAGASARATPKYDPRLLHPNNQQPGEMSPGQLPQLEPSFTQDDRAEDVSGYESEDAVHDEMEDDPPAAVRPPKRRGDKRAARKTRKASTRPASPVAEEDEEESDSEDDAAADPPEPGSEAVFKYRGRFNFRADAEKHLVRNATIAMVNFPGEEDDVLDVFGELHTHAKELIAALTAQWKPCEGLNEEMVEHFEKRQENNLQWIRTKLQKKPLECEARAILELYKIGEVHTEEQIIDDGSRSNKIGTCTDTGMTCSQRVKQVIQMVRDCKYVAKDVLQGRTQDYLARTPTKYLASKRSNARINLQKKKRTDQERAAAAAATAGTTANRSEGRVVKKLKSKGRDAGSKGESQTEPRLPSTLPARGNTALEQAKPRLSRPAKGASTSILDQIVPRPYKSNRTAPITPSGKRSSKRKGKDPKMPSPPNTDTRVNLKRESDESPDNEDSEGQGHDDYEDDEEEYDDHHDDDADEEDEYQPQSASGKRRAGASDRQPQRAAKRSRR